MNPIGAPLVIQNTDAGHWLVTCNNIVHSPSETVSFTVALPRSSKAPGDLQRDAIKRAISLLQLVVDNMPTEQA